MNKFNTYFDKIFCINLDIRPDRWSKCLREFDENNVQNVQRYPGIMFNMTNTHKITNKETGCFMSHYGIFKLMTTNNWEKVLILEDDVKFCAGFEEEADILVNSMPNDFDVVYLGGTYVIKERSDNYVQKLEQCSSMIGYIMSNKFAKWVIDNVDIDFIQKQIDVLFIDYQKTKKFNFYISRKPLVWQRADYSDICGQIVDYNYGPLACSKWFDLDPQINNSIPWQQLWESHRTIEMQKKCKKFVFKKK